ncbi:hypothetical protein PDN14_21995 [Bacillus cereus group sp. Bc222]|uniref:hypothetical protein n=1 Tax=Bacillus cereus group sp. Bc222 TaxID=3018111 RepID=UPI0022E5E9BB|nr:hypothetical protein [Bacillus cereus group sp. Bc222]MDA2241126.1 hypothetical protein [Bacillus cereus group sp. Bc222]
MSLETNIILSLLDVKLWMAHHSDNSPIQEKKRKLKLVPHLNKSASVNKRKLYKFRQQK